jgi:hypothetical protein
MALFLVAAIAAMILFNCMSGKKSGPRMSGYSMSPAPVQGEQGPMVDVCALKNGGTGMSSALLPKEVATQEDFGEFAPDDILKGQNFLDPRDQIGFPETIGGALRNANQQVRSEPPNPRTPVSIFNNSTIEPDQMRPPFEIGSGLA